MQKDLLAELHLPELDLKSLRNIVTQNSARLASLIKESNEYINKGKTIPVHFKEEVGSMVSDCNVTGHPESAPQKKYRIINRKFILKKSLIANDKTLNKKIHLPTESSAAELNVTQECSTQDKGKSVENEQSSQTLSNAETTPSPLHTFSVTEATIQHLKDGVGRKLPEKVDLPFNKPSAVSLTVSPGESILKRKNNIVSNSESVKETTAVKDATEKTDSGQVSEPAFCVISEVIGNATAAFGADDSNDSSQEASEVQLITPKKTDDITKIKGWRRKQFFVEKPTTVEFYSTAKGSHALKKKVHLKDNERNGADDEEPGNVENAFVCDSLDDFLDREAELKIGYEIPHLYAEFGIKLTRDEIVSTPNLSDKHIKEVETRYCVPVTLPCETIDLDQIKEENIKGVKRPCEDDPKQCKLIKLDDDKRQSVKAAQKAAEKLKTEENVSESQTEVKSGDSDVEVLQQSATDFSKIKLVSKLIALVVYPGPSAPLHPLVQYHLEKIRSYRTKVDRNWADFAASAVLVNNKKYGRKVLPAYCCAKTNSVVNNSNNNNNNNEEINEVSVQKQVDCASVSSKPNNHANEKNKLKKPIKLKNCSVVLERLESERAFSPWCMEHNCYNCVKCGLGKSKLKCSNLRKNVDKNQSQSDDLAETVIVSPRASFDKRIASLLAKKVRLLKVNGDTLKSIDCLKTLTFNTVEFIKLKFVKESFLSGYLNIWYLKPEDAGVRFRAFLTFSHTPPVPNAINLKSNVISLNNLPKVITEIVSLENTFDSNEYAILHCDGKIWEIHGSMNIAFGKCDKNVEQIFTSAELPELEVLQEIAHDILNVKAVKWWVLDLTQKFSLMEVNFSKERIILTREKFIEAIEKNLYGFLPFRKSSEGRVLGALIMEVLLPFVLIGPYYLLEGNDLILKESSPTFKTLPFQYYGEVNVAKDYPLKFFINSVIRNMDKYEKKLEGLWLYDKMCLDGTSYLEAVTANEYVTPPNKYASIYIEHGYSLNSLTNSILSIGSSGFVKRKDGKEEIRKIPVYLYFDIFDLGFVEGQLQFDNSVIISHPLDKRTKMKSHKIGDWFIGIIKRRIEFIPKDLVVRWFITKHKQDLRERRPFNKFFLGGAHILTRKGIYYLLEMTDSKMQKLGINKSEIMKAISQSEVINEVKELKNLSNLLANDPTLSLSMFEVLTKAVSEIQNLRQIQRALKSKKAMAEKEKLTLCSRLIKKLNECRISNRFKIKIIEKLDPMFRNEKGDLNESFSRVLRNSRIGRKYLVRLEGRSARKKAAGINSAKALRPEEEKLNQTKSPVPKLVFTPISAKGVTPSKKTTPAILNVSRNTAKTKDTPKLSELHIQIEKIVSLSNDLPPLKSIHPKFVINSIEPSGNVGKDQGQLPTVEKLPKDLPSKNDKFFKLSSPELPENIKLCWKNWSVNKLGVA